MLSALEAIFSSARVSWPFLAQLPSFRGATCGNIRYICDIARILMPHRHLRPDVPFATEQTTIEGIQQQELPMWFYLTVAVIAGISATYVCRSFFSRTQLTDGDAQDVEFYRRQLTEIDHDLDHGNLSPEDAARTRVEVSRRLLEADKRATHSTQNTDPVSRHASGIAAVGVVALLFGAGGLVYAQLGGNGRPDAPLAARFAQSHEIYENRISQAAAEERVPEQHVQLSEEDLALVDKLRTALESRPDDAEGFRHLARQEAQLGNYTAARNAQTRVVELAGPDEVASNDLILLARIMAYGANGYVSPEAEALWSEILQRNPNNAEARYYLGLMYAQIKRPDITYIFWEPIPDLGDPSAPWMARFNEQFGDIAYFAGKNLKESETLAGPTSEQMASAQDMSAEERQEMILAMVANLGDRIDEGDATAAEWAQFIRAKSVLGDNEVAKEYFDRAKALFAENSEDSLIIKQTGVETGLEPRVEQ